jgi:uncharacterized cupredoxin-like copper-binding protein
VEACVRSNTIARTACLFAGLALVLAACAPTEPGASGPVFDVTIRDFRVRPSNPTAPAGTVTLSVSNIGPTTHEFVVVRTDLPDGELPIGADGLSVDEDRLDDVDEIEGVEDGSTEQVTVRLDPGRYVFFCNFEGHYLAGMHAAVRVVGDA